MQMDQNQKNQQNSETETQTKNPNEINQNIENQNQEVVEEQKHYMYVIVQHPITLQNIWMMHQYYVERFSGLLMILGELRETVNVKWTQQQINAYLLCLHDIQAYVVNYCWDPNTGAGIGTIAFYEDFTNAMVGYGENTNPVGFELYQKQLEYMQKKATGYDFRQDKKKKNADQPKQEQPKKRQIVQKKQEVLIRTSDPEINIQKLMSIEWPKDKYIDTALFHKQNANLVFIGHVDSGKSTLTGNILLELGEVDEQQWLRNKQDAKDNKMESWQKAGVSDVIPEERIDGKTRECAKLMFNLEKKRFTLFDAPGHKNYVPNMIMGACQADLAVLIISAKDGEFQSGFQKEGQTKQHAMLAKALGVFELIVVVTKLGTVNWNQKRFQLIKEQVTPFLDISCGFHNVIFIPVDSLENINIHKRIENSWYKGPSLLEYLNDVKLPVRTPSGPLRIPVIDKFKDVGSLYVYGKLESGTIIEDQTVTILPSRKALILKQIYNAKDERLPFAMAGENVKIKVKGIEENEISRGDVLCNNLNYCQQSCEFKAHITILDLPDKKKILSSGYECVIHMHAIAEEVEISKVEAKIEKDTKKQVVASFLKTGETGTVTVKIQKPICLQKYEFMPSLGRFTLRDEGKTIGYGEVIKIKPAKTLLKEQKDQLLGEKKEVAELENQVKELVIQTKTVN